MIPAIHPCRDSFIGIALILQYMAETGKSLSELVAEIPRYVMVKRKISLTPDQILRIVDILTHRYASGHIDTTDGLKIFFDDQHAWIHIRPSNTEPIIRIISEAPTQHAAEVLNDRILAEAGLDAKYSHRHSVHTM